MLWWHCYVPHRTAELDGVADTRTALSTNRSKSLFLGSWLLTHKS
jgi:hypothetical protein